MGFNITGMNVKREHKDKLSAGELDALFKVRPHIFLPGNLNS